VEFELRRDLHSHLVSLPYGFFREHHRGDLIARMMNDAGNVRMMVGMVTLHFTSTIATTVLSLAMMFALSPSITLLSIVPICFLFLIMRGFMGKLHHIFTDIQTINGNLSKAVSESLSGIRVIKNYLLEDRERRRFEDLNASYMRRNLEATRLWGLLFPFIGLLGGLGTLIVMWLGGYYLMHHRITLGDFIALNTYYLMLMWPIVALGWILNLYQRGTASVKRIEEITASEPERAGGIVPATLKGAIVFEEVSVAKDGRSILDNLSFHLGPGERLLVVGPTGSGKSTLLNLILGLEQEYNGSILVDGTDTRKIALSILRRRIALVPQEPFLYSTTIRENLFPDEHEGTNPETLIDMVQMKEEVERFDRGVETVVGERGITLSGGQKQRLTLARALTRKPSVLLLDDPFTHVDGITENAIWKKAGPALSGVTMIITSSKPVPLNHIDKVLVFTGDGAAVQGTAEEMLRKNPYMKLLYEVRGYEERTARGSET
jgi:ATP-binding cassette, subfamily B, multidrug efflux pump